MYAVVFVRRTKTTAYGALSIGLWSAIEREIEIRSRAAVRAAVVIAVNAGRSLRAKLDQPAGRVTDPAARVGGRRRQDVDPIGRGDPELQGLVCLEAGRVEREACALPALARRDGTIDVARPRRAERRD